MARIASESKGGYYPTPVKELEYINHRLVSEAGISINLLDPCCGKGEALHLISQHLKTLGADPKTYGVELERGRASDAQEVLDHCIYDGYENLRTEAKYSLLYLNPPYQDGFGERVETTFLRNLTGRSKNVLQENGLLIYVVPQYVLADSAGVLSSRFSDISIYRFSDDHYDVFKQVVLFARYKRPGREEKKEALKMLKEIAKQGKETLPPLNVDDGNTYELFPSEQVQVFRAGKMNDAELAKDLSESPLIDEVKRLFDNTASEVTFERPVLELKPMHYSVAAMADTDRGGYMGNHYLVSDVVKKKSHKENIDDEGETKNEEVIEYYQSRLRVFSHHGVFDLE